jgi:hypothetical protein
MIKDIETNLTRCVKLPNLKVTTVRSNSARLNNEKSEIDFEEATPCFNHSEIQRNDSNEQDLSLIFRQILQEQKALKMKIREQGRLIQKMYKKRPPLPVKFKNLAFCKENLEKTGNLENTPLNGEGSKKFRFPREIFTSNARPGRVR